MRECKEAWFRNIKCYISKNINALNMIKSTYISNYFLIDEDNMDLKNLRLFFLYIFILVSQYLLFPTIILICMFINLLFYNDSYYGNL